MVGLEISLTIMNVSARRLRLTRQKATALSTASEELETSPLNSAMSLIKSLSNDLEPTPSKTRNSIPLFNISSDSQDRGSSRAGMGKTYGARVVMYAQK
jgi:hypothetical protein